MCTDIVAYVDEYGGIHAIGKIRESGQEHCYDLKRPKTDEIEYVICRDLSGRVLLFLSLSDDTVIERRSGHSCIIFEVHAGIRQLVLPRFVGNKVCLLVHIVHDMISLINMREARGHRCGALTQLASVSHSRSRIGMGIHSASQKMGNSRQNAELREYVYQNIAAL